MEEIKKRFRKPSPKIGRFEVVAIICVVFLLVGYVVGKPKLNTFGVEAPQPAAKSPYIGASSSGGGGSGSTGGIGGGAPRGSASSIDLTRKQKIIHTINGRIYRGQFEDAVATLLILMEEEGGYKTTEVLTYESGQWKGTLVLSIPSENVTLFVLYARSAIGNFGEVTKLEHRIEDITKKIESGELKEEAANWSRVTIKLVEEIDPSQPVDRIYAVFGETGELLFDLGLDALRVVTAGIPLALIGVAIVLLATRVLKPLGVKLYGITGLKKE